MPGTLWLIVGPSGTGKSTLVNRLTQELPRLREVVSYTSRAPRANEIDGVTYHFVDRASFERMHAEGKFVEHVEYGGNLYGLAKKSIDDALAVGDAIIIVDGHGMQQLQALYPNAMSIFLAPPAPAELRRRLLQRGDSAAQIESRLALVPQELPFANSADFRISAWRNPEMVFQFASSAILGMRG